MVPKPIPFSALVPPLPAQLLWVRAAEGSEPFCSLKIVPHRTEAVSLTQGGLHHPWREVSSQLWH